MIPYKELQDNPTVANRMIADERYYSHRLFQKWQEAVVINMINGDGYVPMPRLPKGYRDYASVWFGSQVWPKDSNAGYLDDFLKRQQHAQPSIRGL